MKITFWKSQLRCLFNPLILTWRNNILSVFIKVIFSKKWSWTQPEENYMYTPTQWCVYVCDKRGRHSPRRILRLVLFATVTLIYRLSNERLRQRFLPLIGKLHSRQKRFLRKIRRKKNETKKKLASCIECLMCRKKVSERARAWIRICSLDPFYIALKRTAGDGAKIKLGR